MSAWPTFRPRVQRRFLVLLSVLATFAAVALPTSGALAAGPSPSPPPDRIALDVIGLDMPAASGTPVDLVSADRPFAVTVTFLAGDVAVPYSTRTGTSVRITVSDGRVLTTATVPAGASSVTVPGLRLPAANGVTLTAQAVDRKAAAALAPGRVGPFDVVLSAGSVPVPVKSRGTSVFVTATGSVDPCQATAARPTCVDVLLPNGVDSDVFFSTGLCTGGVGCRDANGTVLQVLADLDDGSGALYTPDAPATLIFRCDKTQCGGGSIQSNRLQVNLDPSGPLTTSPACGARGFMDGPDGHCVDYVQSRRDGSGDTYLYLLITRDARMSH